MIIASIGSTIFSADFAILYGILALLVGGGYGYYRVVETRNWSWLCWLASLLILVVLILMLFRAGS